MSLHTRRARTHSPYYTAASQEHHFIKDLWFLIDILCDIPDEVSELMAGGLLLPGGVCVIRLNRWGWTRMVKATFLTLARFIGRAVPCKVCSNTLICMGPHVADVCVTLTSSTKHNDKGQIMNSLAQL